MTELIITTETIEGTPMIYKAIGNFSHNGVNYSNYVTSDREECYPRCEKVLNSWYLGMKTQLGVE